MSTDGGQGARDDQTYAIIGAAMEVHRGLGSGFLEIVYHKALAVELAERGVPYRHEVELPISYKGQPLDCIYRADFVCFDSVIVELKALSARTTREHSQVIHYLKATGFQRGLLLNFGTQRLEYKRVVWSPRPEPAVEAQDVDDM